LVAALAALALAGCDVIPLPRVFTSTPPPERTEASPPFVVAPARETAPDAPVARVPPSAPAAPLRPLDDDPNHVVGMDQDGLQKLLGTPAFMRRDAAAQLWRYTSGGCVLDMFLYRNGSNGPFVVRHLTARAMTGGAPASPRTGAEINPRVCLGALLRARGPSAAG
jgi:hypothetical protein